MFTFCVIGALVFMGVGCAVIGAAFVLGGREWTEHFGENHWQTFVYMIGAASITGSLMYPIFRFLHRKFF